MTKLEALEGYCILEVDLRAAESTTNGFLAPLLGKKGKLIFIPGEES